MTEKDTCPVECANHANLNFHITLTSKWPHHSHTS